MIGRSSLLKNDVTVVDSSPSSSDGSNNTNSNIIPSFLINVSVVKKHKVKR